MEMIQTLVLIIQVLSAIGIIALVLVQQGKGSDIGAAFGSGASNTMFGSAGSTSFLMRITVVLAVIFFATSLAMSYFSGHSKPVHQNGILNLPTTATMPTTSTKQAPVASTSTKKTFVIPHSATEKK